MKKLVLLSVLFFVMVVWGWGQISITTPGSALTQDFNSLALTGTSSTIPLGWAFLETGSNANTTYSAGTGSGNSGDTYSFGATSSSDRAFGGLLSGSLVPTLGASYTNNIGSSIAQLVIAYTGEQWRLGATGRVDRLDFQYSTNATSLITGTWTDVDNLDFTAPVTSGTTGALDGNATSNHTSISYTITGLTINPGSSFWIRFNDLNATGSDDGMAIDDWSLTAIIECSTSVAGYFQYYNAANTTLNNVDIELKQSDVTFYSTTTNPSGYFEFLNVCPGTYDVVASKAKIIGGINSTDAAQVNYWSVHNSFIEKVRFLAGDVTGDLSVLSGDASLIQQYFITQGNPNPAFDSDWSFWKTGELINSNPGPSGYPTVTIPAGATSVSQNFYGLVTGDFNRSYVPGSFKSGSESLTLNYGQVIEVSQDKEFALPLIAEMEMGVGAISLILNFPSEILEINGVYLTNDPNTPLQFNVSGDELRIGWNSLSPVALESGEPMLTLLCKVNSSAGEEGIRFKLAADPLNELADGDFGVISNAVLTVDILKTSELGTAELSLSEKLTLRNHPNPFKGTTSFTYSLPADGKVTLEIYDIVGNKVKMLLDEMQVAGDYLVKMEKNDMQPGVYTATLHLEYAGDVIKNTIKIIKKNN